MKRMYLFVSSALFSMALVGCGGENDQASSDVSEVQEDVVSNDADDNFEESDDVTFMMPSPIQVADLLNSSGLVWTDGITHNPENFSRYTTEVKRSLNFGIYSMDLAYSVLNNRATESEQYLNAVRNLALETGLDEIFNSEDLVNRFEANMGNKDSIFPLLFEIHERTEMVLADQEDKHKTVIHFAGAWSEGMYLGTKTAVDRNNTELGTAVVNQMVILENIIKGLESYPDQNAEITAFTVQLKGVLDTYYNFESVKNNEDKEYLDPTLTSEELNILKDKIVSLRQSIVNA